MSNLSVNAIRFLGIDAINKANSGHPGVVMGAAPMAYSLFTKQLRINPAQPNWINRDRFILSAGHGSMLLYALLHLSGFEDVSMDEVKNFRQWGSKTPGHPEFGHTAGVDATTGPLGQGISTATGFAQAERFLAAKYNREGYNLFDHYTYVICGDGDLMEGVSSEAASYAGLQKLDKLVVLMIQMISTWMVKQRIPLLKVFVTVTMLMVGIQPWLKMGQTCKQSILLSKQLKLQANHL